MMSAKMTWEETIISIRKQPEYSELVEKAYFDENLILNVERFKSSDEYAETKKIIRQFSGSTSTKKILDIGSGNGISAVSFALDGFEVTSVEPDKSETVGSGAIKKLKQHYQLSNLSVIDSFGENLPCENNSFDIVYIRQTMHHASDLKKFVSEAARVLKREGVFFSTRDHVIFNDKDKQWFLETHPLQKFYGGENAFTFQQYESAITNAGLKIVSVLRHFDSVINLFPNKISDFDELIKKREQIVKSSLKNKLPPFIAGNSVVERIYSAYVDFKIGKPLNEKHIPGRLISFIAIK